MIEPSPQRECYNQSYTFTCTAVVDDAVTTPKVFSWRVGQPGSEQDVVASAGNQVSIVDIDLSSPRSTSILTVSRAEVGMYRYVCKADLQTTDGRTVLSKETSGEVTIRSKLDSN